MSLVALLGAGLTQSAATAMAAISEDPHSISTNDSDDYPDEAVVREEQADQERKVSQVSVFCMCAVLTKGQTGNPAEGGLLQPLSRFQAHQASGLRRVQKYHLCQPWRWIGNGVCDARRLERAVYVSILPHEGEDRASGAYNLSPPSMQYCLPDQFK